MKAGKKILFLLPHSILYGPSQRYRVGAFLRILKDEGFKFKLINFISEKDEAVMYKQGSYLRKMLAVISGFFRMTGACLFTAPQYDYIFIQRGASPIGPPVFEWWLTKILRKKIIFDFDDAIWMPNSATQNKLIGMFKAYWKIRYICKWSYKVSCGNEYLCNYARKYNPNVVKLPTCVDTKFGHHLSKQHHSAVPTIGWTGTHTTTRHLALVEETLIDLRKEMNFNLLVISNKPPQWKISDYDFLQWSNKTEAEDLVKMDIGVMPLIRDDFSEGKCGFKLIQYMAVGLPALASDVGVNKEIIDHGINGFICYTKEDWYRSLQLLIQDPALREKMGAAGQKKIRENFSIDAQAQTFLRLFS